MATILKSSHLLVEAGGDESSAKLVASDLKLEAGGNEESARLVCSHLLLEYAIPFEEPPTDDEPPTGDDKDLGLVHGGARGPIKLERQLFNPEDHATREELWRLYRNQKRLEDRPPVVEFMAGQRDKLPKGYYLLDGGAISRALNPVLFAHYGTQYGEGDGTTTFNLPDLIGKVPIGSPVGKIVGNAGPTIAGSTTGTPTAYILPIIRGQ